jgi:hypothetical protein
VLVGFILVKNLLHLSKTTCFGPARPTSDNIFNHKMLLKLYHEYLFNPAHKLHGNYYTVTVYPKVRICSSGNVFSKMLYVKEKRNTVGVLPAEGQHMSVMNIIIYKLLNL